MAEQIDVLVVGAGPTGMVLASELRRRGVPVRLIDKRAAPGVTSRSFTLHAKTMEMFEHMGLAHVFLTDGIRSRGFYFNFKGKPEHPALDFTSLDSPYPYILVYNQDQTERRLLEHLDQCYDLRPEWSTTLTELKQTASGSRATLHSSAGAETITARWVVGCDGIHSFVREACGLEFQGANYDGMVMQMMDVRYDGFEGTDDWVHYYISKESFLLITKLPSGNHRVLISDMGAADDPNRSQRDCFQQLIDGHVEGTRLAEPDWGTKWTIWKRIANAYSRGNVFLAGDAAHVHSPSGGQGMNAGMQDAFNLGWKLALVARGEARPALLESYDRERQPIGAQVISGTDAMHDIIMAHGHGMDDRLALTRAPGWHADTVSRISGLSYHYRDATPTLPGYTPPAGIAPGDRAPDVALGRFGRLFDLLRHPRLTLLIAAGTETTGDTVDRLSAHVQGDYDDSVAVRTLAPGPQHPLASRPFTPVDESGAFALRYGSFPGGHVYLLRPDGYVAFHCELADAARMLEFLALWLVPMSGAERASSCVAQRPTSAAQG